jgi:peptidoglycan/xylan/chitin deacetylase (PgdA/CDA1 family)
MDAWSLLDRAFGWGGVIAYHGVGEYPHAPLMHVSPTRLRAQLHYLRDKHDVVPLRELVRQWRSGESTAGRVAITFDDAYAGVAMHALPILRELDLPATVFVASDHALRGGVYWWDLVDDPHNASSSASWREASETMGLDLFQGDRSNAMEKLRTQVITRYAGRWPASIAPVDGTVWRSLSFPELATLANDERIDFGVHTVTHPALPFLPYEDQVSEIRDNLIMLRARLPRVLPVVAYPYGLYDRTTVNAACEAGMIAGLTMAGRASADRPSPMMVPRIGAGEIHTPKSLGRKLSRVLRPALIIRDRGIHPRLPRSPFRERAEAVNVRHPRA